MQKQAEPARIQKMCLQSKSKKPKPFNMCGLPRQKQTEARTCVFTLVRATRSSECVCFAQGEAWQIDVASGDQFPPFATVFRQFRLVLVPAFFINNVTPDPEALSPRI